MIRILVVDDHPVVREGIVAILAAEPDFEVIGQAANGEQAIREASRSLPDVVVLDVRMPGSTGMEVCTALMSKHPGMRVVILTCFPNENVMLSVFAAGARGFLVKESEPSVLRTAVRQVAVGGTFIDPRIAGKFVALATKGRRAKGPFGLTLQEMRVVELLPRGMSNREIGRELGVSEQTVKTHLHNAMRKLRAKDRTEVAAIAMREGLA
jgi:two-component system, NarL family, response regulator DevR